MGGMLKERLAVVMKVKTRGPALTLRLSRTGNFAVRQRKVAKEVANEQRVLQQRPAF